MIDIRLPCCHLAGGAYYTTTRHVWYTDEHIVTLLAEHTILCLVDVHT
jgi:hypothetical protein